MVLCAKFSEFYEIFDLSISHHHKLMSVTEECFIYEHFIHLLHFEQLISRVKKLSERSLHVPQNLGSQKPYFMPSDGSISVCQLVYDQAN